ncbi:hypothetical protein QQP08_010797 [Theobroma cacao]|nr:hypothetical protein QQP08_010797 [Theobroma cacao]
MLKLYVSLRVFLSIHLDGVIEDFWSLFRESVTKRDSTKKRELDTWPNQGDRQNTWQKEGAADLGAFCVTVGGARTEIAGGYSRVSRDHMTGPGFTLSRGILCPS